MNTRLNSSTSGGLATVRENANELRVFLFAIFKQAAVYLLIFS